MANPEEPDPAGAESGAAGGVDPAWYRDLVESAPDAVVVIDPVGHIVLVNRQAERLFGYPRSELLGQPIETLIPERLRGRHEQHRGGYFADPKLRPMGAGLDLLARRRDGSEFPVEISLSPLQTRQGPLATATVRDITERRSFERKLADYAENLERSNKELEQFAYAASHDLRAPLRGITGFAQILQRRYAGKLDAPADEFLQYIVQSAADMQKLIDALLAFSRVGRVGGEFETVDMGRVLERVLAQLRSVIEERGAIVTHDPMPTLFGSQIELGQLLQNLLSNAIKFQPGPAPKVHVGLTREGDSWHFVVADQGIGIGAEHQSRVFQIFQRLHPPDQYEGTGIGLAICKKIVQHHGGRIWLESEVDKGTRFHFSLPIVE